VLIVILLAGVDKSGRSTTQPSITCCNSDKMDADLDDILNEGPAVAAAPSAAEPAPAKDTSCVETAPAPVRAESSKEPIVEAAPMSTESAVLVSAPEMKEDSKDAESDGVKAPSVSVVSAPTPDPTDTVTSANENKPTASSGGGDDDDDGGWGLSSVTAALGGWGFGGSGDEADNMPSTALGSVESDPVEEEEWKHQAEAVEDAAAAAVAFLTGSGPSATTAAESVEEAMEGAASAATAAASSFFSGASDFLAGANPTGDAAAADANATTAPPPDANDPTASALRSLYDLNPMNKMASGWIDALERENADADPHRDLRAHLDNHLKDWPRSTYEEWVEEALCALEGWDAGSAVVDDTFYIEGCVHRNIWNETNYQRAEEEGGEAQREFVPARGAGSGAAGSSKASVQPAKKGAAAKVPVGGGTDDDADLDGLIGGDDGEEEIVFVESETPAKN